MIRKNLFILALLLTLITAETFADFSLRLSYGFMFNDQLNDSSLQDGSFDLGAEFLVNPLDNVSIGFGVQYVWPAEYEQVPEGINSNPINTSVPVYGVALYNIMPDSTIEPYLVGRLGYGFISPNPNSNASNIAGDFFYSIGIGGIFNNFYLEATYDVNSGNYVFDGRRESMELSRFTVRVGYGFEFITQGQSDFYNNQVEVVNESAERTYDNLELYDDEGNLEKKKGTYKELKDFQITD